MVRRVKHMTIRKGDLIPLGNNFAYVSGDNPNKVDDVDIGPNNRHGLSVNDGEVMQFGGQSVRVFSAEPILNGVSPSRLVQQGMNPDLVFAAQERYKDVHGLKDDGSKAKLGGIHIKPSKRGTFTAAAKRHGMTVQAFASKVLANKGKYSSAMVKKANFARNAKRWHHEFGGIQNLRTRAILGTDDDFNNWYSTIAQTKGLNPNPYDKEHHYNYRAYYNNEVRPNPYGLEALRINTLYSHFPDTYKLPGHPTFSNESIYSSDLVPGGHWEDDKFVDSEYTKSYNSGRNSDYGILPLQGNPLYDISGETKYLDYTNEPDIDFSNLVTTKARPYNEDNLRTAYDYFKAQGANDYQIAALLANLVEESGVEPYALDDTGEYYGISQWAKKRYTENRKSKKDKDYSTEAELSDLNKQLAYYYNSVMNGDTAVDWNHGGEGSGYKRAVDARQAFRDAASVDDAIKALVLGYVRPTGKINSYKNRAKVAEQIYKRITNN